MNISKITSYIGFSIKSGSVIFGVDNIEVYRKKIHLIIISNTLSDKSKQKIERVAERKGVEILQIEENLEDITKKKNCKVLAITNFELAKAIKNS